MSLLPRSDLGGMPSGAYLGSLPMLSPVVKQVARNGYRLLDVWRPNGPSSSAMVFQGGGGREG
jgi:hypothetical protein